jgi:hypothetical protein
MAWLSRAASQARRFGICPSGPRPTGKAGWGTVVFGAEITLEHGTASSRSWAGENMEMSRAADIHPPRKKIRSGGKERCEGC